jgi:MtN3 and saliva related transmembrane protein
MIDWALIIGMVASILVTVAYIPEVVKTVRARHTRDLSLAWIVMLDVGQLLFLIYGIDIASIPLMFSGGSGVVMMSIMLAYKLMYKNK